MKFLDDEHRVISRVLNEAQLAESYQLIKSKGWVYIEIGQNSFGFHRDTISELIEGKLVTRNCYQVRHLTDTIECNDLSEVISQLKSWVGRI